MDSRVLDQLQVDKSLQLMQASGIEPQLMCLLDEHWQLAWSNADHADASIDELIVELRNDFQVAADSRARLRREFSGDNVALCCCQADEQEQLAFSVLVLASGLTEEQARLVELVCSNLENEYQLNAELEFMATELGERYDELNMMFVAEGGASPAMFGFESLVKLVQDTSESLDVGMTGLLIPGKGIEHFVNRRDTQEPLLPGVSRFLRTQALEQVQEGRSIVINQPGDQARYGLASPFRSKLIITPLTGGSSHVIGLLVVINDSSSRDFANSDRNLLQVMASRIDKVLHVNFDPLTGLENAQSYEWAVARTLSAVRSGTTQAALLSIDIDRFSVINSACGREVGDLLITQVADLLAAEARACDTAARIGGDKFGLLLKDASLEDAALMAEKLRRQINRIELIPGEFQHVVSACIGVTSVDEKCHTVAEVLTMVELASKTAKEKGTNRVQEYQDTDLSLASRRWEHKWVGQIFDAISKDHFVLYAQLIQPLEEHGGIPHYEVLVRMCGEEGEILPPNKFIPAAEHYRLMPDLDWWVVRNALEQIKELQRNAGELEAVFSINLSGQSLTDERLQYQLFLALDEIGDLASKIVFEVTESAAIYNMAEALDFMRKTRSFGCKFSLDDFGSGLSSFSYLQKFNVDYLKIDGSFVRDMAHNDVSRSMVFAINHVGQMMGLSTIAEFVEDAAIVDCLRQIGVNYAQGYHYGRPRPLHEICDELIAQRQVVNG